MFRSRSPVPLPYPIIIPYRTGYSLCNAQLVGEKAKEEEKKKALNSEAEFEFEFEFAFAFATSHHPHCRRRPVVKKEHWLI
jgi:hypothetical protein